jgi:DNA mismatch repair protein MutS
MSNSHDTSSMISEYFNKLEEYKIKFGNKTFLLWQCGSFYEIYGLKKYDDNNNITTDYGLLEFSRILECRIANKGKFKSTPLEMAGFTINKPLNKYVPKLIQDGYTVVVWEEYAEKIVKKRKTKLRRMKGVYSSSTIFESNKKKLSNYCCVVWIEQYIGDTFNKFPYLHCGISLIDNFTGKSKLFEFRYENNNIHNSTAFDQLERFISIYNPSETIFIHNYKSNNKINDIIQFIGLNSDKIHTISLLEKGNLSIKAKRCEVESFQNEIFTNVFKIPDFNFFMKQTQMDVYIHSANSYCFLLDFIIQHNAELLKCIDKPVYEQNNDSVYLATHCLKQLNIIDTGQSINNKFSSVLRMMNRCKTAMGRRSMKNIILHPSTNIVDLNKSYEIMEYIIKNISTAQELDYRNGMNNIRDIQKLYRKVYLNMLTQNDIPLIYYSITSFLQNYNKVTNDNTIKQYLTDKFKMIPDNDIIRDITCMIELFSSTFIIDKCTENSKTTINIFNRGLYEDLDIAEKKQIDHIQELDAIQRFISNLIGEAVRVHSTEKNGMYLQLTNKRKDKLEKKITGLLNKNVKIRFTSPYDNTEVLCELDLSRLKYTPGTAGNKRISSPKLNELYDSMLRDSSNMKELIKIYFYKFNQKLKGYADEFTNIINYISNVDILFTKTYLARKYNYCRPNIDDKYNGVSYLRAERMRHVLIENLNKEEAYVPNDISLEIDKNGILLYGTNAVGKSSLIKSIGISTVLAQSGMFVPCSRFDYFPYKSIFTRILGNDNIFKGLSSFAVEMCELNTILTNCCQNSLVLGDELCSGTEINSALALFSSGVKYLCNKRSSFIFATHLHELLNVSIIKDLLKENLIMYHMSVKYDKSNDMLIYKRKLEKGPGEGMYGLEVCKSLNLPEDFIDLAYNIRITTENKSILNKTQSRYNRSIIKNKCGIPDCNNLADDIHHLNPQEYSDKNGFFKDKWFHKDHASNLIPICKKCHLKVTKNKTIHRKTKTTKGMVLLQE